MRYLTILVDMDDTISGLQEAWFEYLNEQYGLSVTKESLTCWDLQKAFPSLTNKQIHAPLRQPEFWDRVQPYQDAIEYLEKIIDRGHEVYIVTSSYYKGLSDKLDKVLFKYFKFINYDNVIITKRKQMIRGDVLIDDYPDNLVNGAYWGILFDQPHNHGFDSSYYDIKRAYSWSDVYRYILDLEKSEDS